MHGFGIVIHATTFFFFFFFFFFCILQFRTMCSWLVVGHRGCSGGDGYYRIGNRGIHIVNQILHKRAIISSIFSWNDLIPNHIFVNGIRSSHRWKGTLWSSPQITIVPV
ncbi:hypothetical protein DL93DRAFT_2075284 [Clavulina sp. PMI_390]|nr:hypothetical protein DL93DRAFT_2075284 [Clavulina sp. PMI_390]